MSTSPPFSKPKRVSFLTWIVWGLAVAFYFYEFMVRVTPSVLVAPLMKTFSVDAATIGFVSGTYYFAYAPLQLPIGVLMDRFGARRLLSLAALLAGLGTLLFGLAPNLPTLYIARILIGSGSAFAFVGLLYITSHWFDQKWLALLIGIGASIGIFGAAVGEGPINELEEWIGWRGTVVVLGIIGIVLAVLFFLAVHSRKATKLPSHSFKQAFRSFGIVLRHPQSWISAFIAFSVYATTAGFAALWGPTFLIHTHGMSSNAAAFATSMIFVGWFVGGPLFGHLSDRFRTRKKFIILGSLIGFFILIPVIYFPQIPEVATFILLFCIGLFSATELLVFSFSIDFHPEEATGSATAFINFIVMLGGALFQPLVGFLLDAFWSGGYLNGIKAYTVGDYQLAMSCFPLFFLVAFLLSFFMQERYTSPDELKK